MLHKQQTITVLTAAALIAAPAGPAALAAQVSGSMTLTVGSPYLTNNGTSAAIDAQGTTPVVESPGYTLLPLRGVVEAMGGTLAWDAASQTIAITLGSQTWTLTIGSATAVNQYGQTRTLAVAPRLTEDGRTLVHIRALELFSGVTCSWNNATQQVYITYSITTPDPAPAQDDEGPAGDTLLILTNETGEDIDAVKWSAAGASDYSANVLQSALLGDDETEYLWLDLDGDASINLKVTYADGGSETYEDLDLTGVDEAFEVAIQDDGGYDGPDDAAVPDMEDGLKVSLYNESGVDDIAEAYLYPSGEDPDDYDGLVYEAHDERTLAQGDWLRVTLDAADDDHLWDLYLVYDDADETEAWVEGISLTGASDEAAIVVTDEDEAYRVLDDNTIELDETASEVTARIYNDLGEDYTLTYIEASPADGDDWYTVSSGDVEDGDYVSEDFDLDADGSEWDFYFEVYDAYDDEYEDYYLYGVDFDDAYDDNPYLYIEWYDSGEDDLDYTLD